MGRVVVGVDPGETTGLASIARRDLTPGVEITVEQTTEVGYIWDFITQYWYAGGHAPIFSDLEKPTVVLEGFNASGSLSAAGHHTLHVVGFIKYRCLEDDIPCVIVEPSKRKAYLDEARRLAGTTKDSDRHEVDALAHVLAYVRGGK